jgi:hypothetical protein
VELEVRVNFPERLLPSLLKLDAILFVFGEADSLPLAIIDVAVDRGEFEGVSTPPPFASLRVAVAPEVVKRAPALVVDAGAALGVITPKPCV